MEIKGIITTTVLILALIAISTASAEPICWAANTSWDAPDVGNYSVPAFADLDGDGDYDLLIGEKNGTSYGYENIGNASSPDWTRKAGWDVLDVGTYATPAFADLDGDGDYDLLIGEDLGVSYGYENTGSASSPDWTANTDWDAPDVGLDAQPAFADLDGDGDYDLLIGEKNGTSYGYENIGNASSPDWTRKAGWDVLDVGTYATPAFADLDGDGDYDLLIGEDLGVSYGYENTPDTTPPVITITTPEPYELYTVGMTLDFSATDDESSVATVVGNLTNTSDVSQTVDSGFAPAVGVYTLVVTATDNASNTNVSDPVFFVVYDPDGGHATGGGWFYPDGDSTLPDGKANFGFTARYKNDVSTGKLNFQYSDAGIHLKSTSIDWLTISAVSAQFQGTGTINGDGLYTFRVQAKDNGEPGVDVDHFDIKIWNGTDTEADPYHKAKNTISGGNIQVHTN